MGPSQDSLAERWPDVVSRLGVHTMPALYAGSVGHMYGIHTIHIHPPSMWLVYRCIAQCARFVPACRRGRVSWNPPVAQVCFSAPNGQDAPPIGLVISSQPPSGTSAAWGVHRGSLRTVPSHLQSSLGSCGRSDFEICFFFFFFFLEGCAALIRT
ncbi:hypothetical protein L209DRAFT_18652 [Thermothelomyces heterothallicus CBS 203.75]